MGFLYVDGCCCYNLRTGGLIIGYIGLVLEFSVLFLEISDPISWLFLVILISVLTTVGWLYGIHKNKWEFMSPDLIIHMTTAIMYILVPILIWFGVFVMEKKSNSRKENHVISAAIRIIYSLIESFPGWLIYVSWMILAILIAIHCYFTTVKFSLFMLMKNPEQSDAANPQAVEIPMTTINLPEVDGNKQ